MSATKNYLAGDTCYTAIRIPYTKPEQAGVRGDNILSRNDSAVSFEEKQAREHSALMALRSYAARGASLDETMQAIEDYDELQTRSSENPRSRAARMRAYRRTLKDRPWTKCDCSVCREVGIEVVIFRGNNRNRRRGFHNVRDFYRSLRQRERAARESPEQYSLGL